MSEQNRSTSPVKSSSDIRLFERVRLQSFQGLLPDAGTRVRCPGKHPPVLIEDLLKAEIISLQLVLAIEEVAKSVKRFFESGTKGGKAKLAEEDQNSDEAASLANFQSALSQGTNALNQLTNLQISESLSEKNMPPPKDTSSRKVANSVSTPVHNEVTKRLQFNSDEMSGTIWMPSPSWDEDSVLGITTGFEKMESNTTEEGIDQIVKDSIEALRKEIQELQIKHEKQFTTFAGKYWSQEEQSMRKLLEKIMANLSPQDKNWTYHGKFDDHCMEQLFYFVSLQKTLKSCLALLSTINTEDQTEYMEEEIQCTMSQDYFPSEKNCPPQSDGSVHADHHRIDNIGELLDARGCQATKCATKICSGCDGNAEADVKATGKNNDVLKNSCSALQTNGKRMNEFEDEQQSKRQKKNKGIFACFNTRWKKSKAKSKRKNH